MSDDERIKTTKTKTRGSPGGVLKAAKKVADHLRKMAEEEKISQLWLEHAEAVDAVIQLADAALLEQDRIAIELPILGRRDMSVGLQRMAFDAGFEWYTGKMVVPDLWGSEALSLRRPNEMGHSSVGYYQRTGVRVYLATEDFEFIERWLAYRGFC